MHHLMHCLWRPLNQSLQPPGPGCLRRVSHYIHSQCTPVGSCTQWPCGGWKTVHAGRVSPSTTWVELRPSGLPLGLLNGTKEGRHFFSSVSFYKIPDPFPFGQFPFVLSSVLPEWQKVYLFMSFFWDFFSALVLLVGGATKFPRHPAV